MIDSRRKALLATSNIQILELINYYGEGVMAHQQILEYMKRFMGWSSARTRTELGLLEEYNIIERDRLHRLNFFRLKRYAKTLLYGEDITRVTKVSTKQSTMVRSLIFNEYVLTKTDIEEFKTQTIMEFLVGLQSQTSMFYRQKEGFNVIKSYVKQKLIQVTPTLNNEMFYLQNKMDTSFGKSVEKVYERHPIFDKQINYHGLQQMNIHFAGGLFEEKRVIANDPNSSVEIGKQIGFELLFFQADVSLSGSDFLDRIKRASMYLKFLLKVPDENELKLHFTFFGNNEDKIDTYRKFYNASKEKPQDVTVDFKFVDIDTKYFKGRHVLLAVK